MVGWRLPVITVKCPNTDCPASFQVPEEYLGKSVRCKKCNTKFKITNNNGFAPREARPPTAVAKTLYETTASIPALAPAPPQAPPQDENADAARKRMYLYLGLGAGGVFSCLAVMCVVGIAVAWSKFGGRSPEIYGGIEISSTTVKASVVKFFSDADGGYNYEFLSDDAMNAITNMDRITPTGDLDPDSFEKTAAAVSKFYKDLQNKHNVAPDKIVIVAASGVFKPLDPAKAANTQEKLRNRVLADTRRPLEIVNPERELELQIKSLIPEKEMDRSLLVDLGNSDCRGGNYDATLKRYNVFNTKVGVKGFLKKAEADAAVLGYKKSKTPANLKLLATAASKSEQKAFREPLSTELNKSSSFNGRKRIELIGGIPWVTATYKNPAGRANKHTKLKNEDFDSFYKEIRRDFVYPQFTMPKGIDESLSKKMNADVEKMEERIPIENLIAGTEMMKTLSEELIFQNREVYFNNNGQKALVLGLMTEMWEQGKK
jgi:hypothetical protein